MAIQDSINNPLFIFGLFLFVEGITRTGILSYIALAFGVILILHTK